MDCTAHLRQPTITASGSRHSVAHGLYTDGSAAEALHCSIARWMPAMAVLLSDLLSLKKQASSRSQSRSECFSLDIHLGRGSLDKTCAPKTRTRLNGIVYTDLSPFPTL
jgi:hypothetical protein